MNDINKPKICYTAGGMLIHDGKALLVKHKKLGIWLNPGGHIDDGELPHEAAEREFFEETGVKVKAIDVFSLPVFGKKFSLLKKSDTKKEFKPNPISTNLHWVNRESYDLRIKSNSPEKRFPTKLWKRGCEQHIGFFYLLEPVGGVDFYQNEEETDGIAWFSPQEILVLDTHENILREIQLGFKLIGIQ